MVNMHKETAEKTTAGRPETGAVRPLYLSVLNENALHFALGEWSVSVISLNLCDLVNRVHAVDNSAERSILPVQEEGILVADEEL